MDKETEINLLLKVYNTIKEKESMTMLGNQQFPKSHKSSKLEGIIIDKLEKLIVSL